MPFSNIAVEEILTGKVYSCLPEDNVRKAVETMQQRKVRRLPVVAPDGTYVPAATIRHFISKLAPLHLLILQSATPLVLQSELLCGLTAVPDDTAGQHHLAVEAVKLFDPGRSLRNTPTGRWGIVRLHLKKATNRSPIPPTAVG